MYRKSQMCNFKLYRLIAVSICLIMSTGFIAYQTEKKNKPDLKISEFFGYDKLPTMQSIMIGLSTFLVFGFIDNAGLWIGMDTLEPYMTGGPLTKAALGNTFSDGLGAFLGLFCGIIIKNTLDPLDKSKPPIWAEAIGMILGCLIAIPIMSSLTGKK